MKKYRLDIVSNLRILIRAIYYFVIWGIPAMWKAKALHIRAAWFAAKITAKANFKQEEKIANKERKE